MKADIITKAIIWNSKKNRFLIVKRCSEDDVGADTWENVGGSVEEGEDLEEALRREIREECGITDIEIRKVAYTTLIRGKSPYLIIAYLCQTATESVTLSPEHTSYLWADETECRNKLPEGILDDFNKNKIWEILRIDE